jgi:hypothetical protein
MPVDNFTRRPPGERNDGVDSRASSVHTGQSRTRPSKPLRGLLPPLCCGAITSRQWAVVKCEIGWAPDRAGGPRELTTHSPYL